MGRKRAGYWQWEETIKAANYALHPVAVRQNPFPSDFTPSYDVPDGDAYLDKLDICDSLLGDPDAWQDAGCKRDLHVMVEGGRSHLRYPHAGPFPRDPRLGGPATGKKPRYKGEQGKPVSSATERRLAGPNAPYAARTQSPKVRSTTERHRQERLLDGSLLEHQIAEAIARYRETQPDGEMGLLVPSSAGPLIKEGMPPKAAKILVSRAGPSRGNTRGSFFPGVAGRLEERDVSMSDRVIAAAGTPIMVDTQVYLQNHREKGELLEVSVEGDPNKSQFAVLLDADDIEEAHSKWVQFAKRTLPVPGSGPQAVTGTPRKYRGGEAGEDDQDFIRRLFGEGQKGVFEGLSPRVSALQRSWGVPFVTLELYFRGLEEPFLITLSGGEHSNSSGSGASPWRAKYKTLDNVPLYALPRLLARLSRRKKRKGRRLPRLPIVRNNPMMSNPGQLQDLILAAQQRLELVDVPGKPGRVYWYSKKRKAVVEVSAGRAKTWLAISAAGKKSGPRLSAEAQKVYAEEGMLRSPEPASPPAAVLEERALGNPMRDTMKNPKNLMSKMRPASDPYEIWRLDDWEWRVLKKYQASDSKPHARWYCLVKTPYLPQGERGGVYASQVIESGAVKVSSAKNPSSDELNWFRQYNRGSFGAQQSIPAARRNRSNKMAKKRTKRKPTAWNKEFGAISGRAREIQDETGCQWKKAWDAARAEMGGQRAAANPWYDHDHLYLPDTTQVRPALVRAPHPWRDETEVFSALVPGPYGRKNPKAKNNKRKKKRKPTAWNKEFGAISSRAREIQDETGCQWKKAWDAARAEMGGQRAAANPRAHWKKQGHPAYSQFQSRPRMANYEQVIGQFSPQQGWVTRGMQPMNRRNPNTNIGACEAAYSARPNPRASRLMGKIRRAGRATKADLKIVKKLCK